ncbi:hypothetical protein PS934_04048 [Pseudomonas fluorescens]|uniref:hypothetical protein n=1 Tax=Pseudomonas fluorescens TaxID=294 RepID=UPI001242F9CD|nr:hypothetical protein [Pseudomonas fluorescens]VVQ14088.1 hypothetical protein PS934_04048 [Pseudomonas fluorescens]
MECNFAHVVEQCIKLADADADGGVLDAVLVSRLVAAGFDARQVEQTRRLQLVAAFLGDLLLQHPHAGFHPGSALSCPNILIFQQS